MICFSLMPQIYDLNFELTNNFIKKSHFVLLFLP